MTKGNQDEIMQNEMNLFGKYAIIKHHSKKLEILEKLHFQYT